MLRRNDSTGLTDLQELLCKKCKRPLSVEELNEQVKRYITYLRKEGAVVKTRTCINGIW